ncbi:hypothetical protein ACV28C_000360 [Enterobacter asburiae]|uniref:Uncharacterized protein n=1 Tax=Enterobacter asburiae TaxID=61645 RepID=A0ABC9U883_ENTAS|nr:hypothetical protein [Enterobacter asburiae]EMB8996197.1 hypothetical protein [Enterobacter asburiae]ESM31151.1 hypothetical protein L402_03453 [Enterobacter asburiae]MDE7597444.1 hypothetical protein [Enterobacter asburiae]SAB53799.1 Uncharacterised protein [Enterobacter asburiae]HDW2005207.1 hypothetical protein [Enterobacter asburiae]
MSEVTDLTVIEIKPEQAPALYSAGGLNGFLEQTREQAIEVLIALKDDLIPCAKIHY